ncbi:MAG: AI-2E family transporter [Ruminococcaceae bacterium]|nr:AI-2E family transporter [Oscillospiraceae bacterium]
MKTSSKSLLKIGIGIFILFLAVYYWSGVSGIILTLVKGGKALLAGAAVAYIINILMSFYERHYFPKKSHTGFVKATRTPVCMIAAVLSLLLIIALVTGIVIPQFIDCIRTLINMIPPAMEKLEKNTLFSKLIPEYISSALEKMNWENTISKAIDIAKNSLGGVVGGITVVVSTFFSGIITVVVSLIFAFYILLSKKRLGSQANALVDTYLPEKWNSRFRYTVGLLDGCFHKFIVGQCIEAVILGVLCFIGMSIFRFPYAPMIAALIGLTALIPVAGAYIGAGVGAFMILTVSPQKALLFLVFIIVLQQLEGNLIYPKVVGTSIGLPGLFVLAAVTVGGALGGVLGMLVSVPLTAAVYQAIRDNVKKRKEEKAAKKAPQEAETE